MLFTAYQRLKYGNKLILDQSNILGRLVDKYDAETKRVLSGCDFFDSTATANWLRLLERPTPKRMDTKLDTIYHYSDVVAATEHAAKHALNHGIGINIGGGMHHGTLDPAEANNGCLINDICYVIQKLELHKKRVLIVDADAHFGGGTWATVERQDWSGIGILDLVWGPQSFLSDSFLTDQKWSEDDREPYTETMKTTLSRIYQRDWDFAFYIAGADVLEQKFMGADVLTISAMQLRDRAIISAFRGCNIPLCITLGGGYDGKRSFTAWDGLIKYCLACKG